MEEQATKKKRKIGLGRQPLWFKIFLTVSGVLIVILLGIIAYIYHLMSLPNYDTGEDFVVSPTDYFETVENIEDYTDLPIATLETAEVDDEPGRHEKGITNILLLGLDQESGDLSDAMLVVTIDTSHKEIKLTSFMRDILVQIPGYANNKLNTPYKKGGIQLVYDVFVTNFDIRLDGYVAVNYNMLGKVIDKLGGINLYVGKAEANFLNTSNYIADVSSRNLIPGTTQSMNGSQVVGFCRNRMTVGSGDDFGRTQKQRQVLNAIYEKFRDQNLAQLISLMETVLPYITTDLTPGEMTSLATDAFNAGILSAEMEQLRVPIDDTYKNSMYDQMSVLEIDFETNIKELHSFIFHDATEDEEGEESEEIERSTEPSSENIKLSGSDQNGDTQKVTLTTGSPLESDR